MGFYRVLFHPAANHRVIRIVYQVIRFPLILRYPEFRRDILVEIVFVPVQVILGDIGDHSYMRPEIPDPV